MLVSHYSGKSFWNGFHQLTDANMVSICYKFPVLHVCMLEFSICFGLCIVSVIRQPCLLMLMQC
jgi:hypothetical protein